jgi:hypothetical protein
MQVWYECETLCLNTKIGVFRLISHFYKAWEPNNTVCVAVLCSEFCLLIGSNGIEDATAKDLWIPGSDRVNNKPT